MEVAHAEQTRTGGDMGDTTVAPVMDLHEEVVHNIDEAIEKVMKLAAAEEGLKTGCNQVMRAIESQRAQVVFLASNVQEVAISKAVTLLAESMHIPVIEVPDSKELGRWAGLCKIDPDGQARKIVAASCVAIVDYGSPSVALEFLQKHISSLRS